MKKVTILLIMLFLAASLCACAGNSNNAQANAKDYDDGYADGYDKGYADGYDDGYKEGYDEGYADADDGGFVKKKNDSAKDNLEDYIKIESFSYYFQQLTVIDFMCCNINISNTGTKTISYLQFATNIYDKAGNLLQISNFWYNSSSNEVLTPGNSYILNISRNNGGVILSGVSIDQVAVVTVDEIVISFTDGSNVMFDCYFELEKQ